MTRDNRVFSEKEIGRVLKRAAEIQGKQPGPAGYGLTMDELRELAAESGIDPAFVSTAAAELDLDDTQGEPNWWGGPLSTTLVRSVPGSLSDSTWEEMVSVLRRDLEDTGATEKRGTTRQWMLTANDVRKAHLIATQREDITEIEWFSANPAMAVPFYVIPLVLSIIALPIIFASLSMPGAIGLALWLAAVGILFGSARMGVARMAAKARDRSIATVEKVTAVAHRSSIESTSARDHAPSAEQESSSGQLELPDESEGDSAPTDTRGRTRN